MRKEKQPSVELLRLRVYNKIVASFSGRKAESTPPAIILILWNFTSGGGKMKEELNRVYKGLKNRCYNPNCPKYKNYGGRGIKVCKEWLDSERVINGKSHLSKGRISFEKWALENGYADGLTLDRINVNGDYEPNNCRWVSMKIQENNRTNNRLVTYKNKTQTLAQWCEELGLNYKRIHRRINSLNWSIEKAFEN